jgi:5'-3' exonuclease
VGGVDLKATAGLVGSMLALLEDPDEQVTHLAIAFDNPIVSFRNDLFDAYKSDEGVPPALRAQFDVAEVAAKALGIVVWSMDEYEADDALATAAVRFAGPDRQVRILTPDKDLGQVLSGDRVVQVDRIRRKVIDEDGMRARRGVAPESIPDLLALVGDTSDGIPGLPGFGEKSAGALLGHYGTIEAIPLDPAAWKPKVTGAPRLAATLAARRDDALLYKKLATLIRDVPLPESLDDLAYRGALRGPYEELCTRLEIRPRLSRFRT